MLTFDKEELEKDSQILGQLGEARKGIAAQLDELTQQVTKDTKISGDVAAQLVAMHATYQRALKAYEDETKEEITKAEAKSSGLDSDEAVAVHVGGLALGYGLAVFTGGLSLLLVPAAYVVPAALRKDSVDKAKIETEVKAKHSTTLASAQTKISDIEELKKQSLKNIKTSEQKRLYFGIVSEILLDNGIHIARQLEQFARFNDTTADAVFSDVEQGTRETLERLLKGQPTAKDIEDLLVLSKESGASSAHDPVQATLRQFVNHLIVPNKTYFQILASFSDDVRGQDLSAFPPLEILGQKPISFSGRIKHDAKNPTPKEAEELLTRAKAKVEVRQRIASNAVHEIFEGQGKTHLDKMRDLVNANEKEIGQYAEVFAGIENAVQALLERKKELEGAKRNKSSEIAQGEKANALTDAKICEFDSRHRARQEAAIKGSIVRSSVTVAGGAILAMLDGGAASGAVMASGASRMFKGFKENVLHPSAAMAGQYTTSSSETGALADYIATLQLEKVDVGALRKELANLEDAMVKTQKSEVFQRILKDEARRSHVAESLLIRSLVRNGYNNSLEIEELCQQSDVASVDAFLAHYEGSRLGLALKKHCHGLADSNDIAVIMCEADCLRGKPSGADKVLKEYVEEVIKPNVAAFYSKASKMDVIGQSNLTRLGNPLHFSTEMQIETNRAVRLLLANEFGMSVIGSHDVRGMFDFWLHRHGDKRLYDEKIRDGEMSDEYPDKRVSHLSGDHMERFVDMAKRSVASGRRSFPKVGDMFLRVCAYEYFLPQAVAVGGKDNIFMDFPEAPSAYPMVNRVISEFIRKMTFQHLDDYRAQVGERLDNVIAQTFIDFFAEIGQLHEQNATLSGGRGRLKDAANYEDYGPVFDRYVRNISRDAEGRFDLFMDIYARNLEKQMECSTEDDRQLLQEQLEKVEKAGRQGLSPAFVQPGSHEAKLRAHFDGHSGENMARRG